MTLRQDNLLAFLNFQCKVNGETILRNEYRTKGPLFNSEELDEMFEAFERGDDPADFARAIYEKDRHAAERMMAGTIR